MDEDWLNLTPEDLAAMGLDVEDVLNALYEQQAGGYGFNNLQLPEPTGLSTKANPLTWAEKSLYEANLEASAPPSPTERRLTRNFLFPTPDQFSFDALQQSDPWIRELLNSAVVAGEGDPFRARAYLADTDDEDVQKAWESAIDQALPQFDTIAEEFHSDDPRWAARDKDTRRELLGEWLKKEGESWLSGAAPSASRNVSWADWVEQRKTGEQFPGFGGAGFDRLPAEGEPRLQTDPTRFRSNAPGDVVGQMSTTDFRRAYGDALKGMNLGNLSEGQTFEDPIQGGQWVVVGGKSPVTALERARNRQLQADARARARPPKKETSPVQDWWQRSFGSLLRFGR